MDQLEQLLLQGCKRFFDAVLIHAMNHQPYQNKNY